MADRVDNAQIRNAQLDKGSLLMAIAGVAFIGYGIASVDVSGGGEASAAETRSPPRRLVTCLGALVARMRWWDRPRGDDASDRVAPDGSHLDVVVVGAGLCGLIFTSYAREAGLRVLTLDAQDHVGGLWNQLPAWQDIQNRREDFAVDGVPLSGVRQPDVARHARAWVEAHDLAPHLRLGCEVTGVEHRDGRWRVHTTDGSYEADHLVVATGAQNDPRVPEVDRVDAKIDERHSSELDRPDELAGRRVTVIGGGTSSWDLLDLAVEHGATDIRWVYRNPRWFLPTTRAKHVAWPNLRELAVTQALLGSTERVNAFLRGLVATEYRHFGLESIEPDEPFDVDRHMLIPGRSTMTEAFEHITRRRGEVRSIEDHEVVLEDGERFETDLVLWATGYRMDLEYLGLPEYADVTRVGELLPKLGSLVRSREHPELFFVGMTLLDSTSSTPFFAAVESRTIIAHIQGRCEIPLEPTPHQITHWDLHRHFARFDRATYPRFWWRVRHLVQALWYALFRNRSVRVRGRWAGRDGFRTGASLRAQRGA